MSLVLILPMRNGNVFKHNFTKSSSIFKFLSYLWGMETDYSGIESWANGTWVLILPMRNGNVSNKSLYFKLYMLRSYPTYEEWKLSFKRWSKIRSCRSYPTYEEWKLYTLSSSSCSANTSFLSYLWGMETKNKNFETFEKVLFLSYLWGMETTIFYICYIRDYLVLILPMRNGNTNEANQRYATTESFLSYLWGMETISTL